jgi:anti-sigma factor RsiW
MLNYLKRRYARARMTAYINGDLSSNGRRIVSEQIDASPDVYRAYIAHKRIKQAMERDLPAFGQPDADRLETLWSSIETELTAAGHQPEAVQAPSHQPGRSGLSLRYRYGLALVLCLLVLLLPMSLDSGSVQASFTPQPLQQAPQNVAVVATPVLTEPLPSSATASVETVAYTNTVPIQTASPVYPAVRQPSMTTPTPS